MKPLNQNKMEQTAVEWIVKQLNINGTVIPMEIESKAKEMEKEQIKDAFVECWKSNVPDGIECKLDAEQYYNETYKQD